MPETERDPRAVLACERTLTEVAESQVVDEAEDVVTRAWIAELDRMRHEWLGLAVGVRVADGVARRELRRARVGGRPAGLARAYARLVEATAETQEALGQADTGSERPDQ